MHSRMDCFGLKVMLNVQEYLAETRQTTVPSVSVEQHGLAGFGQLGLAADAASHQTLSWRERARLMQQKKAQTA